EPPEPPLRVSPEAEQLGQRIALHVSCGRYGVAERILHEAIDRQQHEDQAAGVSRTAWHVVGA
ncbi:MAG: hypothetical protein ACC645_24585, partial [Pirellulales bacterium]